MPPNTVAENLECAARALSPRSDSARLDAELLLCEVTGWTRPALRVRGGDALPAASRAAFDRLVSQRARGVPVAYLTGRREFWSLPLIVTPDVLVPRPETELLVERALALLPGGEPAFVLDLGTGSGAIALALAAERPRAHITAVDVSAAALAVARRNAANLGLSHIDWRLGSWFAAVAGEKFDLILANPPYVASGDTALERLHAEPMLALTPGPTGLEALTVIIEGAAAHLRAHGRLLLEHGADQADAVARLLDANGFADIRTHVDFSDRPRMTVGAATVAPAAARAPSITHRIIHHKEHS